MPNQDFRHDKKAGVQLQYISAGWTLTAEFRILENIAYGEYTVALVTVEAVDADLRDVQGPVFDTQRITLEHPAIAFKVHYMDSADSSLLKTDTVWLQCGQEHSIGADLPEGYAIPEALPDAVTVRVSADGAAVPDSVTFWTERIPDEREAETEAPVSDSSITPASDAQVPGFALTGSQLQQVTEQLLQESKGWAYVEDVPYKYFTDFPLAPVFDFTSTQAFRDYFGMLKDVETLAYSIEKDDITFVEEVDIPEGYDVSYELKRWNTGGRIHQIWIHFDDLGSIALHYDGDANAIMVFFIPAPGTSSQRILFFSAKYLNLYRMN